MGTTSYAPVAALNYSLPYLQSIGVVNIQAHAQILNSALRKELPRLGYPSATPADARSPIVSFIVKEPESIAAKLERANVDAKVEQHLLRISPSIYNDRTDVDPAAQRTFVNPLMKQRIILTEPPFVPIVYST